ncbi:MAG TPA: alpha/beta hydrolase [Acidimicrobiales bacterium]
MDPSLPERYARTVRLSDGRVLGYAEAGDPEGMPMVLFHGTPSSRLDAYWLDGPARRAGWRLIAPDRPAHGLSTPQPGRRLVDVADDVAELADQLGLDRFAVLGFSGGGPYALATAHRLGDRVHLIGIVSGWGPPDRPGAYDGVARGEQFFDAMARSWPGLSRVGFGVLRGLVERAPGLATWLLELRLPRPEDSLPDRPVFRAVPSDVPDLTAGPTAELTAIGPLREALRQGPAGPAEDLHLIVRPWGFPIGDVVAPVRLWHGSADGEIPVHHAEFLARIVPDGRLEVIEGGDHLMLFLEADHVLGALATELRRVS